SGVESREFRKSPGGPKELGQKLPVHVLVEIEGQSNRPKEEIDELHRPIELSKKVFDENVEVFNSGGSTRIALPCVDMLTTAVGKECDLGTASALIRAIQSYGQSENFKATHVRDPHTAVT
ncbi:hypothetical protein MAR_036148, partial [Mya arenaria]